MIKLTEAQLHNLIKNSVNRVLAETKRKAHKRTSNTLREESGYDFYRVQLCDNDGGERSMPEDFASYEEALDYARKLHPNMGERVEIYKMRESGRKVDFVDQVY